MSEEQKTMSDLMRIYWTAGAKLNEEGTRYDIPEEGLRPFTIAIKVVPTEVTYYDDKEPLVQFDVSLDGEEWDLITLPASKVEILCKRPEWHEGPCGDPTDEDLAETR